MSDLVAVLEPIRVAMMVAESPVRPLRERSMDSTGSVPLSFMISRGWPSTLQTRVDWMRQRLLTVAGKRAATYLSDLVAVFEPIKLAMIRAESSVRGLYERSMDSTVSVPLSFMI